MRLLSVATSDVDLIVDVANKYRCDLDVMWDKDYVRTNSMIYIGKFAEGNGQLLGFVAFTLVEHIPVVVSEQTENKIFTQATLANIRGALDESDVIKSFRVLKNSYPTIFQVCHPRREPPVKAVENGWLKGNASLGYYLHNYKCPELRSLGLYIV